LIRQKQRLYVHIKSLSAPSPVLLCKCRSLSNTVHWLTRLDTKWYTERICHQYHGNPKKFWNWINSSKTKCQPIPILMQNGETIKNDQDKANVFNRYFYSVFTQKDLSDLDSLKQSLDHHSPVILSVDFTPSIVNDYLLCSCLDASKACGPDLIPAYLLKYCAVEVSPPLSYLFSKSMSTATLLGYC